MELFGKARREVTSVKETREIVTYDDLLESLVGEHERSVRAGLGEQAEAALDELLCLEGSAQTIVRTRAQSVDACLRFGSSREEENWNPPRGCRGA